MKSIQFMLVTLVAAVAMVACGDRPSVGEGEFLIQGNIRSVPDGAVVELYYGSETPPSRDTIRNGLFEIRDTISLDRGEVSASLRVNGYGFGYASRRIFLSSGTFVRVLGDGGLISEWKISNPSSKLQRSEEQYNDVVRSVSMLAEYAQQRYYSGEVYSGEENYFLERQVDSLSAELVRQTLAYLKSPRTKRDDNWMYRARRLIIRAATDDDFYISLDEAKELYPLIPASYEKEISEISEYLKPIPKLEVGDQMVDGTLIDLNGVSRSLTEFRGRYILLDFWGIGCSPCMQAIPELESLSELYSKTLSVVSINLYSLQGDWQEFCNKNEMKGNQWKEEAKIPLLSRIYQVRGIPSFVLISPEGEILEKWSGYGGDGSIKRDIDKYIK